MSNLTAFEDQVSRRCIANIQELDNGNGKVFLVSMVRVLCAVLQHFGRKMRRHCGTRKVARDVTAAWIVDLSDALHEGMSIKE